MREIYRVERVRDCSRDRARARWVRGGAGRRRDARRRAARAAAAAAPAHRPACPSAPPWGQLKHNQQRTKHRLIGDSSYTPLRLSHEKDTPTLPFSSGGLFQLSEHIELVVQIACLNGVMTELCTHGANFIHEY